MVAISVYEKAEEICAYYSKTYGLKLYLKSLILVTGCHYKTAEFVVGNGYDGDTTCSHERFGTATLLVKKCPAIH
ncbi:Protein of unknown function [Gryllus bimaculatus]|nr:Protein of unknown function [Gryllus bimaculatus]